MGYTIWILLLPFISFVMLGLGGSKMKPKAAGVIGTASLVGVTILSYITAFSYFAAGRGACSEVLGELRHHG